MIPCEHSGDANSDTMVTPGDAQMAFYFYLNCEGLAPTRDQYCAADFCGSGGVEPCDTSVTPADALGIMRFYLGYADPCEKRSGNTNTAGGSGCCRDIASMSNPIVSQRGSPGVGLPC